MSKKLKQHYYRVYTLKDKSTKSIKIEPWRTFRDEMRILKIRDADVFQIQLVKQSS